MIYLFITIVLNVVISSLFKLFPRYNIDTFQAIVVNYAVCVVTGSLYIGQAPLSSGNFHAAWFPWSLLTGVAFISIFTLLGYSTRINGITTTTIANKLSLVIPVLFSIMLYKERVGIGKVAGIVLAFPAVYLTTRIKDENSKPHNLLMPTLIFIGGGLLDTVMKYTQKNFLPTDHTQAVYVIFCFGTASVIGTVAAIALLATGKMKLHWRNIVAGIFVGVPNYFSIYFLIRTLHSDFLQSSAIIPVLNIGIVVASALTAIFLFKEKTNPMRDLGMILSVIAILLIAFGDR